MMLPQKNRLKNSADIKQVFMEGKSARNDFLFLRFNRNNLPQSRVAFSIGLGHSKSAVKRNRSKRLLRAAMQQFIAELEPGFDIVVYVKHIKPENLTLPKAVFCLKNALKSAKILKQ